MGGANKSIPHLRWGILGTGMISKLFTRDLIAARPNAGAKHTIVGLGTSSIEKGEAFVNVMWRNAPDQPRPYVYDIYQGIYDDPNVDIVYVGTPLSLHKKNCLDAIAAGKHVLCEKPFTVNAREAREVIDAAREKGVFVMEGMWTRFFPCFQDLHRELFVNKSIGDIQRLFIDFANKLPPAALPSASGEREPVFRAGVLLDVGVYPLTYASLVMGEGKVGKSHPIPIKVKSVLNIKDGVDEANVVVLEYPATNQAGQKMGKTAICSSTMHLRGAEDFGRIEGSNGVIVFFGMSVSVPSGFRMKVGPHPGHGEADTRSEQLFQVEKPEGTLGFFWEADAAAEDINNGRIENATMPWDETLRMMSLMDSIRFEENLRYPQDD